MKGTQLRGSAKNYMQYNIINKNDSQIPKNV